MNNNINWPSFFPPNCPPLEAKNASGTVYRFVKNNPPLAGDFLTHKQIYPHQIFTGEKLCQACGLSVYISEQDVSWARKSVRGMRKNLLLKLIYLPVWKIETYTFGKELIPLYLVGARECSSLGIICNN